MAPQIETTSTVKNPSRWQKFVAWINDLGMAIDYDSYANTDLKVRHVLQELEKLENRVRELEGRSQSKILGIDSNHSVDEVA